MTFVIDVQVFQETLYIWLNMKMNSAEPAKAVLQFAKFLLQRCSDACRERRVRTPHYCITYCETAAYYCTRVLLYVIRRLLLTILLPI